MSQYSQNTQHKRLTAEQRRRILEIRRRRRMKKRLMIAVPAAVLLLVVLVLAIVLFGRGKKDVEDAPALSLAAAQETEMPQAGADEQEGEPLSADATIGTDMNADDQAPTPAVQTLSTEKFVYDDAYVAAARGEDTGPLLVPDLSKVDPEKLDRWPEVKSGYMPVLYKAKTTENIIAITVDDCFQGDNLRQIISCALQNNGKLTIFPIGDNLNKDNVASSIQYAYENGMELGNHTYNHSGMYHYDDERMTMELYYQSAKLNEVLGVNYQQHFFRPKGGDERNDQRVHKYVSQMGMNGIAIWTQSGSTDPVSSLMKNIAPGRIYLFHTTNNDLEKLLQFIPQATQAGYRLVTLSEMFGLPENEVSDLSTQKEKQDLQSFKVLLAKLEMTSYVRAAGIVQNRLIELGWMEGEADSVYGKGSAVAVALFQAECGLQPNGKADAQTQVKLFADDAPRGTKERIAELTKQLKSK